MPIEQSDFSPIFSAQKEIESLLRVFFLHCSSIRKKGAGEMHPLVHHSTLDIPNSFPEVSTTYVPKEEVVLFSPSHNSEGKIPVRTLPIGKVAFSSGFDVCSCILAIDSSGVVFPFHVSGLYVQMALNRQVEVMKVLNSAKKIIMIGQKPEVAAEELRKILTNQEIEIITNDVNREFRFRSHDAYILNTPDEVMVYLQFFLGYREFAEDRELVFSK
jgi:hypothetical protein